MPLASFVESLRHVSLFQGLRPLQLSEIARRADRVVFKPGDTIISKGCAGDAAYLIISGKAARTAGPNAGDAPEALGPGTVIGEMAMLVETTYSSTIVCQEPTRTLKITRDSLFAQMSCDLALADHIVDKLSTRLKQLATDLRRIDQALGATESIFPVPANGMIATFQPALPEARH